MNFRRLFGNSLIGLGLLNIVNFFAPRPIPTVGISAFIVGGLLIGAGIALKMGGTGSSIHWRRLGGLLRNDEKKGARNGIRNGDKQPAPIDPLLAVKVLRLAEQRGGTLTVAQTAMELNVPLDDAQEALDECARKGGADIEVDPNTAVSVYRFREFL
jgi:hypothetical protein